MSYYAVMADYTLYPSILPGRDEPFVDSKYGRAELERKDYQTLREIAAAHPSEDVDGRMPQDAIIAGLEGKERVE